MELEVGHFCTIPTNKGNKNKLKEQESNITITIQRRRGKGGVHARFNC